MIDENLCRAELSPAQEALHISRRKELYEIQHPETANGATGGGHNQLRQLAKLPTASRLTLRHQQAVPSAPSSATRLAAKPTT